MKMKAQLVRVLVYSLFTVIDLFKKISSEALVDMDTVRVVIDYF